MKYKLTVLTVLSCLITQSSFAGLCQDDQNNYASWNDKCEKLSASSVASGGVGGIFAICTFGISMAPCVGLSIAAFDACCKRDEHRDKLKRCQEREKAISDGLVQEAENLTKMHAEIDALDAIGDKIFTDMVARNHPHFDRRITELVENYAAEGWDLESEEAKEYLAMEKAKIEADRVSNTKVCARSRRRIIARKTDMIRKKYGKYDGIDTEFSESVY